MKTSIDVHNFLQAKGIKHEIFLVDTPTLTAQRAAALLGLKSCEVTKSVLFLVEKEPVLVVLPGDCRVSYKKMKKVLGTSKIKLASPDEVVKYTGYTLGATPPLAHQTPIKVLIDKRVAKREIIYTGAGDVTAVLKIRSEDLIKVIGVDVIDVCKE